MYQVACDKVSDLNWICFRALSQKGTLTQTTTAVIGLFGSNMPCEAAACIDKRRDNSSLNKM